MQRSGRAVTKLVDWDYFLSAKKSTYVATDKKHRRTKRRRFALTRCTTSDKCAAARRSLLAACARVLREQLPAHGVEAGLLVVGQRVVKAGKRGLHRLDTRKHGLQAAADSRNPRRRRVRHFGRTGRLDRSGRLRRSRLYWLRGR